MYKIQITLLLLLTLNFFLIAQTNEEEQLEEIIITSSRIELPFSKNSKTLKIITSSDIKNSVATNVTELLQQYAGIDIVQRGSKGMQADLKIRGGNFEQTLILIDGIKTDDPQTGHHTMNMMIPLENIERIEIVKGAAARIFGQNAFTGAINIVTKKQQKDKLTVGINMGSYNYRTAKITAVKNFKKSNHFIHFSRNESEGYRENTDFKNTNIFLKSNFNTNKEPIQLIASFADRKFGAQYFYTSPASNFTEYEETQTSLVGVSSKFLWNDIVLKPKMYWKRNQDIFLLKRYNPAFSRNHNISNKIGMELNSSYKSTIGITGFGIDVAKVSLTSNNLGDQHRTIFSSFIEHRIDIDSKLDITPGVSINYYSDFGFQAFPGLDVGYKMNKKTNLYWNIGSSYRVPSYTELYINIPNFLSGNADLKPEKAVTQEMGLKYHFKQFSFNSALFFRVSKDLIDYVKATNTSPFYKAENLRRIVTRGIEFDSDYRFHLFNKTQKIGISYTFLDDDYGDISVYKSRYLLNSSIKHHFTARLQTTFIKNITQSVSYRYVDKPLNTYHLMDVKVMSKIKDFELFVLFNNVLDTDYFEKEFIKMPKSNFEFGLKYTLD